MPLMVSFFAYGVVLNIRIRYDSSNARKARHTLNGQDNSAMKFRHLVQWIPFISYDSIVSFLNYSLSRTSGVAQMLKAGCLQGAQLG